MDHKRNMVKLFQQISSGKYDIWDVFQDFLIVSSVSISNTVDYRFKDEREDLYMKTISKYSKENANKFAEIFAELTLALEENPEDVLGDIYQELRINNKWRGQFFTPSSISEFMGEIIFTKEAIKDKIEKDGYVTVYEPCCGGGSIIIGAAKAFQKTEYNYQTQMKVTAGDIDIKSVYMTYIQCSLLGIEARVAKADALGNHPYGESEEDVWYTPMVYINIMREKEREKNKEMMEKFSELLDMFK